MSEYEREKRVSIHHTEEEAVEREPKLEQNGEADADDEERGSLGAV